MNADHVQIILASINNYFKQVAGNDLRLYVEGEKIDMASLNSWAEIRSNGPRIKKQHGKEIYEIDVNIMASHKTSIYGSQSTCAQLVADATEIPVLDRRDLNDIKLLGCLTLRRDVEHQLEFVPWGKVTTESELSIFQTSVEAFYQVELDT